LLVTLGALAAMSFARSRPWLAAVGLAVASIKPTFGVPLAILLFARRDFKTAIVGSALSIAAALVGLGLVFGPNLNSNGALAVLTKNQRRTAVVPGVDAATSGIRIDLPFVFDRLLGNWPPSLWSVALPLALLGAAGMALFALDRRTSARSSDDARRVSDS